MTAKIELLLLSAKEAAKMCGLSLSTWYNLAAAGKLPDPVRLGRSVKWRWDELQGWIKAGCPPRDKWNARTTR